METENELNELYDLLVNNEIATEEEIQLCYNIIGLNIDTLNSILFARTGYRNLWQYLEYEES